MKRGKREEDDGAALPDGEMMKNVGQNDYKYLEVLEANVKKTKKISEKVKKEYIKRIKMLLESKLNGSNIIKALNRWAVAVLTYSRGSLG